MNIKLAWTIVVLLVIVGVYMGVAPQGARLSGGMIRDSQVAIDQHFIEEMIPHHQVALTMANLASERSSRPEIIALANDILNAQSKEINQMRAWYKDWFGADVPAEFTMMGGEHMQGMLGSLDGLKVAKDFDKEFLQEMIVHHEMAVMMARMLESGTVRPEMKQLASSIIASQSAEIAQMHLWLSSWYGLK